MAVIDGGKRAVTHYDTLNSWRGTTHEAPETDVPIRSACIWPPSVTFCVGDTFYGADSLRCLGTHLIAARRSLLLTRERACRYVSSPYPVDLRWPSTGCVTLGA